MRDIDIRRLSLTEAVLDYLDEGGEDSLVSAMRRRFFC